ncbi:WbqC family protein [Aliamphritea spongicola]|nr:WbqC family protein [Aliamphritea spongicola]
MEKPLFNDLELIMEGIESISISSLAQVNIELTIKIARLLELDCTFHNSSEIDTSSERSQRLLDLIRAFGGLSYFSPEGAREYLERDGILQEEGIDIVYQEYEPLKYRQYRSDQWHSHLSIVDVIANIGLEETKHYIRRGFNGL